MLSNIYYFLDERGRNPVKEFIDSLPIKEQAKVFAYLIELKNQGYNLRRPIADYVGNGIYELRPKNNRIFYFFFLKERVVLVHAVRKKTKKIPPKDFKLSIRRKALVEEHKQIKELEV